MSGDEFRFVLVRPSENHPQAAPTAPMTANVASGSISSAPDGMLFPNATSPSQSSDRSSSGNYTSKDSLNVGEHSIARDEGHWECNVIRRLGEENSLKIVFRSSRLTADFFATLASPSTPAPQTNAQISTAEASASAHAGSIEQPLPAIQSNASKHVATNDQPMLDREVPPSLPRRSSRTGVARKDYSYIDTLDESDDACSQFETDQDSQGSEQDSQVPNEAALEPTGIDPFAESRKECNQCKTARLMKFEYLKLVAPIRKNEESTWVELGRTCITCRLKFIKNPNFQKWRRMYTKDHVRDLEALKKWQKERFECWLAKFDEFCNAYKKVTSERFQDKPDWEDIILKVGTFHNRRFERAYHQFGFTHASFPFHKLLATTTTPDKSSGSSKHSRIDNDEGENPNPPKRRRQGFKIEAQQDGPVGFQGLGTKERPIQLSPEPSPHEPSNIYQSPPSSATGSSITEQEAHTTQQDRTASRHLRSESASRAGVGDHYRDEAGSNDAGTQGTEQEKQYPNGSMRHEADGNEWNPDEAVNTLHEEDEIEDGKLWDCQPNDKRAGDEQLYIEEQDVEKQDVEEQDVEEHDVEEPIDAEAVNEEEVDEETVDEEAVDEEAVDEQVIDEVPTDDEPVDEEAIDKDPVAEAPVAEAPVAEEPVAEAPVAEEPVGEEAAGEEAVGGEAVGEEAVGEEPRYQDPPIEDHPIQNPSHEASHDELASPQGPQEEPQASSTEEAESEQPATEPLLWGHRPSIVQNQISAPQAREDLLNDVLNQVISDLADTDTATYREAIESLIDQCYKEMVGDIERRWYHLKLAAKLREQLRRL
ncbi:MAG: hypothetical protein M1831_006380 [Alyxoria varia]|nr:MAG: hypothetical protein M1831_006380 [Alyxoria varia]